MAYGNSSRSSYRARLCAKPYTYASLHLDNPVRQVRIPSSGLGKWRLRGELWCVTCPAPAALVHCVVKAPRSTYGTRWRKEPNTEIQTTLATSFPIAGVKKTHFPCLAWHPVTGGGSSQPFIPDFGVLAPHRELSRDPVCWACTHIPSQTALEFFQMHGYFNLLCCLALLSYFKFLDRLLGSFLFLPA